MLRCVHLNGWIVLYSIVHIFSGGWSFSFVVVDRLATTVAAGRMPATIALLLTSVEGMGRLVVDVLTCVYCSCVVLIRATAMAVESYACMCTLLGGGWYCIAWYTKRVVDM